MQEEGAGVQEVQIPVLPEGGQGDIGESQGQAVPKLGAHGQVVEQLLHPAVLRDLVPDGVLQLHPHRLHRQHPGEDHLGHRHHLRSGLAVVGALRWMELLQILVGLQDVVVLVGGDVRAGVALDQHLVDGQADAAGADLLAHVEEGRDHQVHLEVVPLVQGAA